jgi:hypothetical protein
MFGKETSRRERRNLRALRFHFRRLVREAFLPARTRLGRRYGGRQISALKLDLVVGQFGKLSRRVH